MSPTFNDTDCAAGVLSHRAPGTFLSLSGSVSFNLISSDLDQERDEERRTYEGTKESMMSECPRSPHRPYKPTSQPHTVTGSTRESRSYIPVGASDVAFARSRSGFWVGWKGVVFGGRGGKFGAFVGRAFTGAGGNGVTARFPQSVTTRRRAAREQGYE